MECGRRWRSCWCGREGRRRVEVHGLEDLQPESSRPFIRLVCYIIFGIHSTSSLKWLLNSYTQKSGIVNCSAVDVKVFAFCVGIGNDGGGGSCGNGSGDDGALITVVMVMVMLGVGVMAVMMKGMVVMMVAEVMTV